jgi:hypothetical protein
MAWPYTRGPIVLACQINWISLLNCKLILRTEDLYDCKAVLQGRMYCKFCMELLVKIWKSEKRKVYFRAGAQIPQRSRSHLEILRTRRVTWSKFHTEHPKTLGATVQNVVTTATCPQGFVHPCFRKLYVLCWGHLWRWCLWHHDTSLWCNLVHISA